MTTLMEAAPPAVSDALHAAEDGMFDFYTDYYRRAAASLAYGEFCTPRLWRQLRAARLCRHGGRRPAHPRRRTRRHAPRPGTGLRHRRHCRLPCHNDRRPLSPASTTFPRRFARRRHTHGAASGRLRFEVADIGALPYAADSFTTVVAIDTLYFTGPGRDAGATQAHPDRQRPVACLLRAGRQSARCRSSASTAARWRRTARTWAGRCIGRALPSRRGM